jgi:Cu(I)/Ag(I) efflux system membrane fusion protein
MTSRNPSRARVLSAISLLALGLAAGAGGTWYALKHESSATQDHEAQVQASKKLYQCPMHPQVIMDHEGDCPICGMKLVEMEATSGPAQPVPGAQAPSPAGDKGKLLFYRNPMDPSITSPVFLKDQMGMDYIPVYEGDLKEAQGSGSVEGLATVTIDTQRQQLIGLHTAKVTEGDLGGELRTNGVVAVDETRVRKVTVKVEGFVEKLFVDFTGKAVAKGQPLFSLYSPEFVSAQQEYLLALRAQKQMAAGSMKESGDELLASAKRRLLFWDVPASEVDQLEKTGEVHKTLVLRSPISGVVTVKNVVEGARITPADPLFEITDLGHVWVQADLYETELARVKLGTPAELTLGSYQGQSFRGRVAFIDPEVDSKTRTVKVRIEFPNPNGLLKPEMFGEVTFKTQGRKGLTVPVDAVLDSGTRKVVFLALGDGHFEPREVQTGLNQGDQVEILQGLKAGDEVITRANFLVDSESRLKSALAQMAGKP